ncbi:MAG: FAD-dependent oxidoreductase, partial [Romboutsia sp.]|nr:FAD-dependent oxidoreductase [Romboutsia sp.]
EKVIEENNGDMIYNRKVEKIRVDNNKVTGVLLDNEEVIYSDRVINSGNVWNLYNKLIKENASKESIDWANSLVPTYPSLVLFSLVKEEAIPPETLPIEMLVDDKTKINEGELTAYILSIDDKTLCKEGYHTVVTIGPSFKQWPRGFNHDYNNEEYRKAKEIEQERILNVLENRFPGFKSNLVHVELSTPSSLERYILKEKGAVAGPKQQLGQHMMKRLKTKGEIEGLYNCGESTVMGTGTPTVTISGISAANLILRELGIEEYEYKEDMKNYVNIVKHPFNTSDIKISDNIEEDKIAKLAMMCQYCETPICEKSCELNVCIRDINRKVSVGNFYGAKKLLSHYKDNICEICEEKNCKKVCIRNKFDEDVQIDKINSYIKSQNNN